MNYFKILSVIFVLAFSQNAVAGAVGFHGMVLFGNADHYVSHLPMLHHPHNRQLVLKVDISNLEGVDTLAIYEAQQESGQTLFTIAPEILDLDQLAASQISSFKATLYVGHFEQGGQAIGPVIIQPTKVIADNAIVATPNPSRIYHVFGDHNEFYAVHSLGGKGDFDAIYTASAPIVTACITRTCLDPEVGDVLSSGSFLMYGPGFQSTPDVPASGSGLSDASHQSSIEEIIYFGTSDLQ